MRFVILFIVFSLNPKGQTVLTGVVLINGESISGCKIEVLETGISQQTDSGGKFRVVVNDMAQVSLLLSCDRLTCKVLIRGIKTTDGEVDLGTIPLFFNETIDVSAYNKLDNAKKRKYEAIRHYSKLIGYINKNLVDTSAVRTTLKARKIMYQFDSLDNKVIVNYEDWNK